MPRFVDERSWMTAFEEHRRTGSIRQAALKAGIDYSALRKLYSGTLDEKQRSTGWIVFQKWIAENPPGVIPYADLKPEAKEALADIQVFALRYFGITLRPWQRDDSEIVTDKLVTPTKEYVLMNGPPGGGKTTYYTWILPLWLICRNREITMQIGSGSERVAQNHVGLIRDTMEMTRPITWSEEDCRKWGTVDAVAGLVEDFGRFKPENSRRWRNSEFVVATEGNVLGKKEPTCAAWGRDADFVGTRYGFIIWDDLVNSHTSGSEPQREKTEEWWMKYGETRLNPGGLLVLQGQRLYNDDLYSTAAKMMRVVDPEDLDTIGSDDDSEQMVPAYTHRVHKAHYDEYCTNPDVMHRRDAPPHDDRDPENTSCLLDPRNISWRDLQKVRTYSEANFQLTWQQDDSLMVRRLVEPAWIAGTNTGSTSDYPGCWDEDRRMGSYPTGLAKPWLHVITCDPSGEKYWGLLDILYHPASEQRIIINMVRRELTPGQFLDYNPTGSVFSGFAEEWVQMGKKAGYPVDALIIEENAAQRWFFRFEWSKQWLSSRKVRVVGHQTQRNKADPEMGVEAMLPQQYEFGRVRFPGNRLDGSRAAMQKMAEELTHWPEARTTDTVMSHWFFEYNMPLLMKQKLFRERPRQEEPQTPTWVRDLALPAYLSA